jgi:hypothetical protein
MKAAIIRCRRGPRLSVGATCRHALLLLVLMAGSTPAGELIIMSNQERKVATTAELVASAADPDIASIVVTTNLAGVPTFRLTPGKTLRGDNPGVTVSFAPRQDGVELSTDTRIESLDLRTDVDRRAIFNDTKASSLGRLMLRNVRTIGVIQVLAYDKVVSGHVEAENVDIVSADARAFGERPKGYGVEVIPGAFVLWNQQSDRGVTITADLTGISVGRAGAPVRGSGIFVSGAGDAGGRLSIHRLETGAVYSDGGIAQGTPDRITGGVFVVSGAFVDQVHNLGPVTTYGPNDMVLDNWGMVARWTADDKITSYGPSGIGFVNFGMIDKLEVKGIVETFGRGSRGFNVYTGTVNTAQFERIITHADGAVGIQISQPVGEITVRRGIETFGGTGDSLVKGVVVQLPAIALSVKPGGSARRIVVAGGVVTHGAGISPLEIHGGVDSLEIAGGFAAGGGGFEKL